LTHLKGKDQDAVEHQDSEAVLELLGISRVGNLAETPEQNRQHLAHDRNQSTHRLGTCRTFLFDAPQGRLSGSMRCGPRAGSVRFPAALGAADVVGGLFSRPLLDFLAYATPAWLAHRSVVPLS
jgi:hypothetical protein